MQITTKDSVTCFYSFSEISHMSYFMEKVQLAIFLAFLICKLKKLAVMTGSHFNIWGLFCQEIIIVWWLFSSFSQWKKEIKLKNSCLLLQYCIEVCLKIALLNRTPGKNPLKIISTKNDLFHFYYKPQCVMSDFNSGLKKKIQVHNINTVFLFMLKMFRSFRLSSYLNQFN